MNIKVMEALKNSNIDFSRKAKEDTSGESFGRRFNNMLEKKQTSLKAKEKLKESHRETSKKPKDRDIDGSKEVLNRNPLLAFETRERTLNLETGEIYGAISQEGLKDEGEIDWKNLVAEALGEDLESKDTEGVKVNFNVNLQEVKNNLSKALGKENGQDALKGAWSKESLEVAANDFTKASSESIVEKSLMGALGKETSKEADINPSKTLAKEGGENTLEKTSGKGHETLNLGKAAENNKDGASSNAETDSNLKNLFFNNKENLEPALSHELESIVEDSQGLDSTKKVQVETVSKDMKPEDASKTLDASKVNLETNLLFNRIQSSVSSLETMDEMLSLENLQNIEDSMIKFMKVSKEGDTSLMKVKLYPEELGSIDISLKFQNGKLIADIMVESEKVRAMFLNNSDILNRSLLEQDIPLKNINISLNDKFNSFGNSSGQGKGRETNQKDGQNQNRSMVKDLNNGPIDKMRIQKINNGIKSLDILV